jgi:hypothetical protein
MTRFTGRMQFHAHVSFRNGESYYPNSRHSSILEAKHSSHWPLNELGRTVRKGQSYQARENVNNAPIAARRLRWSTFFAKSNDCFRDESRAVDSAFGWLAL